MLQDSRILDETQPAFAPDGEWIYFSARRSGQSSEVWRVRVDGSDLEAITPEAGYYDRDYNPHPSPDGTRLVYTSNRGGGQRSRIVDLSDDTVHALDVEGIMPRWSPSGDLIAYLRDHGRELWVMRPDGTGQHLVVSLWLPGFGEYFDWSPDGRFIIARASSGISLVDVSSGDLLPIPGTGFVHAPAWQSLP